MTPRELHIYRNHYRHVAMTPAGSNMYSNT